MYRHRLTELFVYINIIVIITVLQFISSVLISAGHQAALSRPLCLVGGAENSGPCRPSPGGAGEEEL